MSDSGKPADSGESGQIGESTQPSEPAASAEPGDSQEPSAHEVAWRRATLAAFISQAPGMDTVDACRLRLVALRTRIETNWPQTGSLLFRRGQGLGREATADVTALLVALPTPLPLQAGGKPESIIRETDTDMRKVAGRAVDACFALLEGATLETVYQGSVKMLEDNRPGTPEPIVASNLTVGVLVATIIGTLDAISETVMGTLPANGGVSPQKAGQKPDPVMEATPPHTAPPKRGRSVPRI